MILQCLSDVTLIDATGTRLFGPGEMVTLPLGDALKALFIGAEHFKIVEPTPLIPGAAVCWSLPDDRVQGPATVRLVEGIAANRVITVLNDGELLSIHERSIIDINPWPAIDAKLEEGWPYLAIDGPESPKIREFVEWVFAHFDDREPWMG